MKNMTFFLSLILLNVKTFALESEKLQFTNSNLFISRCNNSSENYINCDFNNLQLGSYSIKKINEFNYNISYEYSNCNFNNLNATFYAHKNFHRVTEGKNNATLKGYSIVLNDYYPWYTKTSKYDKNCSFVINQISASLSEFSVSRLEAYINVFYEYKKLVDMYSKSYDLLKNLNDQVNKVGVYNISFQICFIENELKKNLTIYDDIFWQSNIELILLEIEQFKTLNQFYNKDEYSTFRNKITEVIKNVLIDININEIRKNMETSKLNAIKILGELKSFPQYDKKQFDYYSKKLN
ncbi:hypothetical protein QEJ31_05405 [Pigmentibacter sp. JX0631]|uniref:hypothetical protein n=1 Tax=Pigmentibacter sp. JX0631 TaxID=2976982 RepID=UPI0024684BC3|nr:hypothetical protein [Pigmentibacter sp. JX0631]WGL61030.1 hypothetical protein QEJ31_05405 [Pigmentibacter sp. JX0631]